MCVYLLIHVSWILAVLFAAGFRTLSPDCKQNTGQIVSWLSRESCVEAEGAERGDQTLRRSQATVRHPTQIRLQVIHTKMALDQNKQVQNRCGEGHNKHYIHGGADNRHMVPFLVILKEVQTLII